MTVVKMRGQSHHHTRVTGSCKHQRGGPDCDCDYDCDSDSDEWIFETKRSCAENNIMILMSHSASDSLTLCSSWYLCLRGRRQEFNKARDQIRLAGKQREHILAQSGERH
jgi:hypothetical protein